MAEKKKIRLSKVNVTVAGHTDYPSTGVPGTLSFAKEQKLIKESIDSLIKTIPYKHCVKPTDDDVSTFALTKRDMEQWHPLDADGVLRNPPRVLIEQHNEEVKRRAAAAAEKERDSLPENIVSLKELVDSTWLRKKSEKAKALKRKELEKVRATKRKLEVIRNKQL